MSAALELLRLALGLPAVLLLPGAAWTLALIPPDGAGWRSWATLDRLVASFALSVALVPLGALAWSRGLGLPLGTWGSLAVVALLTGSGLAAARWRKARRGRSAAPVDGGGPRVS